MTNGGHSNAALHSCQYNHRTGRLNINIDRYFQMDCRRLVMLAVVKYPGGDSKPSISGSHLRMSPTGFISTKQNEMLNTPCVKTPQEEFRKLMNS